MHGGSIETVAASLLVARRPATRILAEGFGRWTRCLKALDSFRGIRHRYLMFFQPGLANCADAGLAQDNQPHNHLRVDKSALANGGAYWTDNHR